MAKLYPPHIEGALPAFTGTLLRLPFVGSRAVSIDQISGMMAYVKDIQLGDIKERWPIPLSAVRTLSNNTYEIQINVTTGNLNAGEFYKLQLAYIEKSTSTIGYFSDVGIIKYIRTPEISIEGGGGNHRYHYVANYKCADPSEKLYSTQFILRETSGTPIAASDEIIHDTRTDPSSTTAIESYDFLQELDRSKSYILQVAAQTTSGYQFRSQEYSINAAPSIPANFKWNFKAEMDYDNGCVNLICQEGQVTSFTSNLKIVRADESEKYSIWHVVNDGLITADMSSGDCVLWRDFTVEQGQNYLYAVFEINANNVISSKQYADIVYVDYEDSFLFDGERQLRIRFDPKVSSFKATVQEAKTDTIGGKYPFIQRNGYTNYKEFPISGLISHLSDENGYFDTDISQLRSNSEQFEYTKPYSTNLNSENIMLERKFKMEVLNWLNNGEPKLFRSPSEGIFLVRLLNVSLSPVDSLGRMLHSFSATAYEIDECTPELLKEKYNILRNQTLAGIINLEAQKGQMGYSLNLLMEEGYDLIQRMPELKNSQVTNATFICGRQPTGTLNVKINGNNINVISEPVREGLITSIMKSDNFNPLSTDRVILSYKSVQNIPDFTRKVNEVLSAQEVGVWYGFDWTKMVGKIKKFFDYIYSLNCSPRGIISATVDGITSLVGAGANILQAIKNAIINEHGCCLSSLIYAIKDAAGRILGYFDGNTCEIIKDIAGRILTIAPQACITFWEQASTTAGTILNEIPQYITGEKTFTLDNVSQSLQNITANAFTCVKVICQSVQTEITNWVGTDLLTSKDTYVGNSSWLGMATDFVTQLTSDVQINQSTALSNNEIYDNIINSFINGTISVPAQIASYVNSNQSVSQVINNISSGNTSVLVNAGEALAQTACNLLSGVSTVASIIDTPSNMIAGVFDAFNGLFGGGC